MGSEMCIRDSFPTFVSNIYPKELQLIKASTSESVVSFLDLHLSIVNGKIISKIYDKRDDFNFEIVNFPSLDGDVPRATSYGTYVSQLIRFARCCTKVEDFNYRNLALTDKLLHQGYCFHKLRKTFSKFYYRHPHLLDKYCSNLKTLCEKGYINLTFTATWSLIFARFSATIISILCSLK